MVMLVTGATGRIGGATLDALVAAGHEPVALLRSPERAAALNRDVPTRIGDFADRDGLVRALAGVDRMLLCSSHAPAMLEHQLNAVSAAREAGVRRIVKISASPASAFAGTPSVAAAHHLAVEAALAESGLEHASIRPNAFAQLIGGFAGSIARGELALTLADQAISWVDACDVGAVAAAALAAPGPLPATIEVTGPQALTGAQLAQIVAQAVGRDVAYRPIDDEENRARLARTSAPDWLVEHVITIFALLRDRDGDRVTDAVEHWAGRPATSVADVLARDEEALGIVAAVAAASAPREETANA